jgi:hypothetical protein
MKVKIVEAPPETHLKAGDWLNIVKMSELDTLTDGNVKFITEEADRLQATRIAAINAAITASKHFAPKDEESRTAVRTNALKMEEVGAGLGVTYINGLPERETGDLNQRVTAHAQDTTGGLGYRQRYYGVDGQPSLRDVVSGCLNTGMEELKHHKAKGGIVRASNKSEKGLQEAVEAARQKSIQLDELNQMIIRGANFRLSLEDPIIKAAVGTSFDAYAETSGALGVLNTALTLQWNLGHLENMLIMLDDITTDLSGTPVLFQQTARTRYIKVPGVMIQNGTTPWGAGPGGAGNIGNDTDVMVQMTNYAGVPINLTQYLLGATARQLMNEQKAPQLYGLAEYIIYTLVNTAIQGSSRANNADTSTSTVIANSAFVDPTFGAGYFNIANATLATFVSALPTAMNLSKFPGGDEPPGALELFRYAWVHSSLYALISADTNFLLNTSIQGVRQEMGTNLLTTGRFERIGNNKFRQSQLMVDNNTLSGTGLSATTLATVVPGTSSAAKVVGVAGTRSGLLFVSRQPIDYTKVLPEIPNTAAVELFATPKLGITFTVIKYLDHNYETANMLTKLMWGNGIGDERQLMLLRQQ